MCSRKFYKFRSLDGLPDAGPREFTRRAIVNCEAYFAAPEQLNDPYEARFRLEYSRDISQNQIKKVLMAQGKAEAEARAEAKAVMKNFKRPGAIDAFTGELERSLVRSSRTCVGMYSVVESCRDVAMWSYYADEHRGVCLELEWEGSEPVQGEYDIPRRITYSDELPAVDPYRSTAEERIRRVLLTKATEWAHEREWRSLALGNLASPAHGVRQLHPRVLTGVLLGARISDRDREDVLSWVEESEATPVVYRASLSETHYRVEIQALSPCGRLK